LLDNNNQASYVFMKSIKNPNHQNWEKMLQLNETNIDIPIQTPCI